jgi:hypothetical protein
MGGMLVERLGLEPVHRPLRRELFDAIAWALVWTIGGVSYSALRARTPARGWRGRVQPAALAGAAAGALVALIGVIANMVWADGLTASQVMERASAVVLMGALSGVLVVGAAHVLRAAFVPPMPSNDR